MKKKLLLGLFTLGTISMLCGFDSAETTDSVMDKMNEASTSIDSMSADMKMNLDAAINLSDGTSTSSLAMVVTADFGIDYTMDPLAMKMNGTMNLSTLGQNQQISMQTYGVTYEDGAFETYSYTQETADEPGEWVYASEDIDLTALMEQSKAMSAADLAEWGLTFELAPEAADIDGKECYQLTAVMDANTISTILDKVSEMTGEDLESDEVALAMSYLEGLKMNMTYYVDTTTYLPVSFHMDMNDSDLSVLNSLLATTLASESEGTTAELILNEFSIDMTTTYGDVAEITVPQEALDAVAAGDAESLDDMVDDIADAAETEVAADVAA